MYKNIKEPKLFGYVKYFLKKCFESLRPPKAKLKILLEGVL